MQIITQPSSDPTLPDDETHIDEKKKTKTVISYKKDENGTVMKETKLYKIEKHLAPSTVVKRKLWKKFGDAKGDPAGPNPANTHPGESVNIQIIHNKLPDERDKQEDDSTKGKRQSVTCRTCKGAHFSHQCPNKTDMEAIMALQNKLLTTTGNTKEADEKTKLAAAAAGLSNLDGNSSRYVPPALRGAGAPLSSVPERKPMEGFSIRVTNLPENTHENDLREIFGQFGRVIRIFPAKDRRTQLNRGFAYISYSTEDEAANAIYAVNRIPYGNLILKVDWAQPSNN